MSDTNTFPPATLFKRLLSIVYDLILLIAIGFSVSIVFSTITTFLLNNGNAITAEHPYYWLNQIIILSVIFISGFLFYVWFWSHGGQTLGMKTWMLQLVSDDGKPIDRKQAFIRAFVGVLSWCCLGLGFYWSLFDKKNRTWHDILSASHLIQLKKK